MNIVAFVDESGTHDPAGKLPSSQVLVIAGYAGKQESWNKFRKDWKSVLLKHKTDHFHYSPLNFAINLLKNGKAVFQKDNPYIGWGLDKCEQFLADCAEVAASGSKIPFAKTFDVNKYTEAKALGRLLDSENPLLAAMEDFYQVAIDSITSKWPKVKNPITFFFDRNEDPVWIDAVHKASKKARGVGRIAFENKEDCEYYGLQAADLLCGRLREITLGEHGHKGRIDQLSDLDRRLFSRLGVNTVEELRSNYTRPKAL